MKPSLIEGKQHVDDRGTIAFANDFDMSEVKRFYYIKPKDTSIIRAWQGHQKESKWFQVINGEFLVRIVQIDDWQNPSKDLPIQEFLLSADKGSILHIPKGYVNGFKALTPDALLMVYSNVDLENSMSDDYRFSDDYWFDWTKN